MVNLRKICIASCEDSADAMLVQILNPSSLIMLNIKFENHWCSAENKSFEWT